MALFGRKSNSATARQPYRPEAGMVAAPTVPAKSLDFTYDASGEPAYAIQAEPAQSGRISLTKAYKAAEEALINAELPGIRLEVILLVDGSYSMDRLYDDGTVELLGVRTLGFALNVDIDGKIPVISYGRDVGKPFEVSASNYKDFGKLLKRNRQVGNTNMTDALKLAVEIAKKSNKLVLIINITDGDPNNKLTMKNEVIKLSAYPIMLKNIAIANVPFLADLDDMPSLIEAETNSDGSYKKTSDGDLILSRNSEGVRFIDSVDSQSIDPRRATDEEFAKALAEEISECVQTMARVGLLTNVPGSVKDF